MKRQPIKITIEGEVTEGKTTIARLIYQALRGAGFDVVAVPDPLQPGEHAEYMGGATNFQGQRIAALLDRGLTVNLVEKCIPKTYPQQEEAGG